MTVTRDVIYDLLPTYFAGDASEDSRKLVEAYFESDPEFARMAKRFGTLMNRQGGNTDSERAKAVFTQVRARVQLRMAAAIWTLAAVFPLVIAAVSGGLSLRHPSTIIAAAFGAVAMATWLTSFSSRPERWAAAMSGEDD